jgi:hypothetical protein
VTGHVHLTTDQATSVVVPRFFALKCFDDPTTNRNAKVGWTE